MRNKEVMRKVQEAPSTIIVIKVLSEYIDKLERENFGLKTSLRHYRKKVDDIFRYGVMRKRGKKI